MARRLHAARSACYSGRMPSALEARIAPARRVRAASGSPATSRFRTATRCSPRLPAAPPTLTNYSPGADCRSTLACLRALGVPSRSSPVPAATPFARTVTIADAGCADFRPPPARSTPATPAPRCGCSPASWPPIRSRRRSSATRRCAPADAPRHRAADADGRPVRGDRRLPAADDHGGRLTPIDFTPDGAERPGQERRAAGRPAGRGPHHGSRAGPHTRSHGAGARGVRRPVESRRRRHRGRGAPAAPAVDPARCPAISRRPRSGWSPPPRCPARTSRSRTSA